MNPTRSIHACRPYEFVRPCRYGPSSFTHVTCVTVPLSVSEYVGYTVSATKTIVGYVDEDGKRDDSFEGCDFERKIVFQDNTYLTCASYQYHYAYRPEATLLVRNNSWIMLVDGESFEMKN